MRENDDRSYKADHYQNVWSQVEENQSRSSLPLKGRGMKNQYRILPKITYYAIRLTTPSPSLKKGGEQDTLEKTGLSGKIQPRKYSTHRKFSKKFWRSQLPSFFQGGGAEGL
jgi:hypothetical protein